MLKKIMVLASMAVTAVAFAAPAIASAEWTDATKKVEVPREVSFTGPAAFTGGIGGITCNNTHATATLTPGSTATVNSFIVTNPTTECTETGGLAFCTTHSVTSTGNPWTAHTNTVDITITGVKIDNTMSGAFCPYHELTLKGDVTVTPDNPHAATLGHLGGTMGVYNGTTTAFVQNVTVSHTVNVSPSGTYGITT
jgi:hypothetical protein